jgi:hypothetical protein
VSIGSGSPVADYIGSTLFDASIGCRAGEVLMAYLIAQTKQWGEGSGGDTDIASIPKGQRASFQYGQKDAGIDEEYFTSLMRAVRDLAYTGLQPIPSPQMDDQIDALKTLVASIRHDALRGLVAQIDAHVEGWADDDSTKDG